MEKRTKRMKHPKEIVLKERPLGSWRLPSGNIVKGCFLYCQKFCGWDTEIGDAYPLSALDLRAYGEFIAPEVKQRATALAREISRTFNRQDVTISSRAKGRKK